MSEDDLAATAASAPALRQVTALTRWVGEGRKLTQTGQLTMADARHLVSLLGTGGEIDPVIGERVFRIETLADPTHPEHQHLREWLGIEEGSDFDPAHFDTTDANHRLDTVMLAASRTA
jgi:hypothetical protein